MSENEKRIYALLDSVRKTADRAGDTASAVVYIAGKKGEAVMDAAKLQLRIRDLRCRVDMTFREIGGIVYGTHIGTATDPEALLKKLSEIDALKAEITALETEAGKPMSARTCPTCGAEVHGDDVYCGECGAKLTPV